MTHKKRLVKTATAWKQFVETGCLHQGEAPNAVLSSWKICREMGIDPWEPQRIQAGFVSGQEVAALRMTKSRHRPAETLEAIGRFGDENRVVLSVYDARGIFVEALNHQFPESMARQLGVESLFLGELTETISGTNAVTLAMRESSTVRLAGCEHYHSWFHGFSCSAAPLRDGRGNIVGAVGASSLDLNQPAPVLPFLRCAADIYQHWRWLEYDRNKTRYWQGVKLMEPSPELPPMPSPLNRLVGTGPAMRHVREMVASVSQSQLPVMLVGESGVGKEVAAQAIHQLSAHKKGPMIPVNCGSLSGSMAESTLFGYESGSFTGARPGGKAGLIEAAHGGTLFLDELESLSPAVQTMLLRCLEEKRIMRLGGTKEREVDFRLITASKIPGETALAKGLLREDFYYRVAGYVISIPPLRERREDIPLLMETLLHQLAETIGKPMPRLSEEAVDCCCHYPWPGNVRELKNLFDQLLNTCNAAKINCADLPEAIRYHPAWLKRSQETSDYAGGISNLQGNKEKYGEYSKSLMNQLEKKMVQQVMEETGGNISESARRMGISRPTLYRILKEIASESQK